MTIIPCDSFLQRAFLISLVREESIYIKLLAIKTTIIIPMKFGFGPNSWNLKHSYLQYLIANEMLCFTGLSSWTLAVQCFHT